MEQQCFSTLKNQSKQLLTFRKVLLELYIIETQKIINLLNDSMKNLNLLQKKWYVINS